jgi:hypothetical protein
MIQTPIHFLRSLTGRGQARPTVALIAAEKAAAEKAAAEKE